MFRLGSIASRIMLLHAAAVIATAILMPLVLYWFLHSEVEALQRHAMRAQAEALASHLTWRSNGEGWTLNIPADLRDLYSEAYGRYAYAVVDETGEVLFASRSDRLPVFDAEDRSKDVEFLDARRGERIISGASLRREVSGRKVWIQVAEDMEHRDALIDDVVANFFQRTSWITVPILLLLLAIDGVIFRRAILPLVRASDRAEHISPTRTDVRLPIDDIPQEIRPLVMAVNKALDRLELGFRRQREFTADAAHELRTPLTILRSRVETLSEQTIRTALLRDIDGMSRVVSQLLDAAELETLVIEPGERADLHATCAEVAQFMAPLALPHGKNIALSGAEGPVWVKGNAEILRRAIRNLVENALNYAPQGTDVEIVVDGGGSVAILDMGDGIPIADRQQIFKRFWRRDSRRPGGAGLGLSIVKSIMTAHGGTVTVKNRLTGGAEFSMHFILATDVPTEQHRQKEQMPVQDLKARSDPPIPSTVSNHPA